MAEIIPRHYIYGIIIFVGIIIGGMSLIGEFRNASASYIDTNQYIAFNNSFNQYDELNTQVNKVEKDIEGNKAEMGVFGVLQSLIKGSWNTIKFLGSSFNFMDDSFNGLSQLFGVPAWIPSLIMMFITILIVFAIYTIIFQREI